MDRRRESEARNAAETLLSRSASSMGSTSGYHGDMSGYHGESPVVMNSSDVTYAADEAGEKWCGVMTASRRTFCLLVTFDLILTFIVWGIYVKIKSDQLEEDLIKTLKEEVTFDFTKTLFDAVLCAMFRFVCLIAAYALFRIRNPSVIAITTFVTCAYVIIKIFLLSDRPPVSYIPLISSFLIIWIETWFLDFKVLPLEQRLREHWACLQQSRLRERGDERLLLLDEDELTYHTPETWSPVVSHQSPRNNYGTIASHEDNELRKKAEEAWKQAFRLFAIEEGWTRESCDSSGITVYSQYMDRYGKMLKLESCIPGSPTRVFEETVRNIDSINCWNPTVLEYRVLMMIDACTDISYNVTAPAGGGMVSSRDFVTLRHWKVSGDVILSSGVSIVHSCMPPTNHVRGENRLAGWEFRPVANQPDQCLLRMILSTDIKGWIPKKIVDQALTGVLVDFVRYLHDHMQSLTTS